MVCFAVFYDLHAFQDSHPFIFPLDLKCKCLSAVDAKSESEEGLENIGEKRRQSSVKLIVLVERVNLEEKLGDISLNMYLHNALQITKPFPIPDLFELHDHNEAIRA